MKDPRKSLLLWALVLLRSTSMAFQPCYQRSLLMTMDRKSNSNNRLQSAVPVRLCTHSKLANNKKGGRFTHQLQAQEDNDNHDNPQTAAPLLIQIDRILSMMTTGFPLFVTGAAVLGYYKPASLNWVNRFTTGMLAAVMWGTGLTLQPSDFADVWKSFPLAVPVGVACQFIIMPFAAWSVSQLLLPTGCFEPTLHSALYIGLCLVGCSPGGTASNLVTLIARANVALSVLLTSCSTFLAVFMTPLLVKTLLAGRSSHFADSIQISGLALCAATAKVVLLPVFGGMLVQSKAPKLARSVSRWTPFGSVALVSLICGGVVAQTAPLLRSSTGSSVLGSVVALHSIGFAAGFLIPRFLFRDTQVARTISIEVGMQNSALAVVLARSIGSHPAASLPGALSATVHSCMGSFLAAIWRLQSPSKHKAGNSDSVESSK